MPQRSTRNVSLPPQQDRFIDALVASGRYRTASEAIRDGLRLLEEAEQHRLLDAYITGQLSPVEAASIPASLKERIRLHLQMLIEDAVADLESGRIADGPTAVAKMRERLENESR